MCARGSGSDDVRIYVRLARMPLGIRVSRGWCVDGTRRSGAGCDAMNQLPGQMVLWAWFTTKSA